jgi:hypothetical protein
VDFSGQWEGTPHEERGNEHVGKGDGEVRPLPYLEFAETGTEQIILDPYRVGWKIANKIRYDQGGEANDDLHGSE